MHNQVLLPHTKHTWIPVVMRADLMALVVHWGYSFLRSAAIPATWGADIDVPLNGR